MTKNSDQEFQSQPRLTPEDEQIVDQLFAEGRQWSDPQEFADSRARRLAELLQLLEAYPTEEHAAPVDTQDASSGPTPLVAATLARICQLQRASLRSDEQADSSRFPMNLRFQPCEADHLEASDRKLRINWREALSAAALILITVSVTIPMLSNARAQATRQACCSNMLGAAVGFSAYADDYYGELPSIYEEIPEGNWLTTRANSANLFSLARSQYVSLETLACPWNTHAGTDPKLLQGTNWPTRMEASYSYQNQFGPSKRLWANPVASTAVMSDRSPIIDACASGKTASPHRPDADDRSFCHDGNWQSILLSDGRVVRNLQPYVGNDNIWLPRNFKGDPRTFVIYKGTEVPTDGSDSMLIQ